MTSPVSAIEAIEKAMEGVTPGPWYPGHLGTASTCQCRSIVDDGSYMGAIATVHVDNGIPIGEGGNDAPPAEEAAANMRYIAACNPVAMREVLALARRAEALQQEVDSLKQTRQHSREASAALHDAFMEERKRVEALEREKLALLSALATAEDALFWAARQHHEYGNTRAQKATELAAHACRRALLGGENAE
jgi:hypothetical protein